MKYLAILPLLLITAMLWSQPIDNKRMKRDIEVAENILAALIEDASSSTFQGFQVEGTYLESYGMLFSIQNKFGYLNLATSPTVIWDGNRAISGLVESRDRDAKDARGEARASRPARGSAYTIQADSIDILDHTEIKELAETFLADYGYLLTQLPDNEKICIKYSKGSKSKFFGKDVLAFSINGDKVNTATPGFTMVIPKKAVEDHRTGKIDRKTLVSRIEYTENKVNNSEEDRELVLLNSIFNRAYQSDLSEGFFMRGSGHMERIAGLGVLFSYNFSTRGNREGIYLNNGQYRFYFPSDETGREDRMRAIERLENDEDDEDLDDEPDFEEFLEGFKSNIIEYGSTVRNLKGDEVLSFELGFPSCRDCDDRPELVKITAKQSLLERYRTGELDLDEAIGQLQVTYQ